MKYITIFADASFCHVSKAAGIAMWARDSQKFWRASKALTWKVSNSFEAERIALGTAIMAALREFEHEPGDRLSIQSDCLAALDLYAVVPRQKKRWRESEAAWRTRVLKAVEDAGLTLHPKHVLGHSGKDNPRSAVNDWCDTEARRCMRAARIVLAQQTTTPVLPAGAQQ